MADFTSDSETSAPGASKSSLLTIPTETFERIAELADPQDLLSLRLVSKDAADKTLRTFTQVHFRERAFLLCSEKSLRILLAIAEHPEFGSSMRRLFLCTDQLPALDELDSIGNPFIEADRRRKALSAGISLETHLRRQQEEQDWAELARKQERFQEKSLDLHLLTIIFARFRRLGNTPAVRITDQSQTQLPIAQAKTLESRSHRKLVPAHDTAESVDIVIEALALSLFPVSNLTIRFENQSGWSIFRLGLWEEETAHAREVFQDLKKLDLSFDEDLAEVSGDSEAGEIIKLATKLEILSLRYLKTVPLGWWKPEDVMLKNLMGSAHFPALKNLWLHGFQVDFADLVSFCKAHPCLKDLRLAHMVFRGLESFVDESRLISKLEGRTDYGSTMIAFLKKFTGVQNIRIPAWVVLGGKKLTT